MNQRERNHPDAAVDPAGMLALMNSQRRSTQSKLVGAYAWLLVAWAAAWAIGFAALWLAEGPGAIPAAAAWVVFGVCIAAAVATSVVTGVRTSSGIRGRSQLQGALYGWSWTISMVGAWLVMVGLQRAGLGRELGTLLYPALFVLLVGVLYLSGGALWRSPMQYALGIAMIAVACVATFVGAPLHYLIYATAGPVAMLIVAVLMLRGVLPHEVGSAAESGAAPMTELDPVIHAPARLRIMTTLIEALSEGDEITFPALQKLLDMTAGNLTTHLAKLEAPGYVTSAKTFAGRKPVTFVAVTPAGRAAFAAYRAAPAALLTPSGVTNPNRQDAT